MTSQPVRCPICLDVFVWPAGGELFELRLGRFEPLLIPDTVDDLKRRDILRDAYLRCPNPSGDMQEHYLPLAFTSYLPTLVIGMVGSSGSGKSHLLTAMIAEIQANGLQPYGLGVAPVDHSLHETFLQQRVRPMLMERQQLPATDMGIVGYADALLVTSPAGTRPVAFFDLSGGDLQGHGRAGRFLAGAGALIFVVNPGAAFNRTTADDPLVSVDIGDHVFATVLSRLGAGQERLSIPTTVVINKADRLRLWPQVDRWLRSPVGDGRIDAARWREESRDAYALLYQHGGNAWVLPFDRSQRCTLHFASATGSELHGDRFVRGVRPRRVLEPLLALLAMTGSLPGAEAERVGRP